MAALPREKSLITFVSMPSGRNLLPYHRQATSSESESLLWHFHFDEADSAFIENSRDPYPGEELGQWDDAFDAARHKLP